MKTLFTSALTAVALALSTASMAHGPVKAQHGGIVKSAHDLSFELVVGADAVTLYVDDHGQAKSTNGATGKLTVLHGKDKREISLLPASGNAFEALGAQVVKGDTLVASVTFADKVSATVRFKIPVKR